jgi:uncharacterized membrane protein
MGINIEGIIFSDFVNNLVTKEWYLKLAAFAEDLSRTQMIIMLTVALVLLALMVYRKLGAMSMLALLFLYFIIYVLFQFDLLTVYEEREIKNAQHMQSIQDEINMQ